MATPARASRALLFMRHCRRSSLVPSTRHSSSYAASSSSPYAPSNFTRQAPSPPAASSKPDTSYDAFPSSSSSSSSSALSSLPTPRPLYAHPKSRSPPVEIPGTRLTPYTWLLSLLGFAPKPAPSYTPAPFRVTNNPYRARKKWPPDFRNLDPKQQFHFEKTYRRRAALKWARPRWNKAIKLLQQTLITATIVYFVFICEPSHGMGTPFDGFRMWFFDKLGKLGQLPESTREEADKLSEEAKKKMKSPVETSPTTATS
ncbi:uncharacterized protein Z519_04897 [Cladophialophora bantiana CBS 173.52]|uniref:Uncharacterized protein n=1 Tax=Cladophialophora bantiana (strain ATCC 10958 / CBS 173.52 / CDC B-1940 / NIH 8579) TaxID=1442370 RepID=A0A0D2HNE3_CLAB1|nr:uncharacterized protein Z519_04897 [Cladophialophora bantiana CBS 173.52]KIW94918.1 hypothetical protein Z519_04897 [Cladophialophora bantiana CBS 173.52]